MLPLLVPGMLDVLKELVVFVGGIFERVNPQTFWREIIESKNKIFGTKKRFKNSQDKFKNPSLL